MESNSTFEIVTITGHEVTIAHNDTSPEPFLIAFFEVNGAQIIMQANGDSIDKDIKAIIASFYELNK